MTPDEIKRAYDEAAAAVRLAHEEELAEILKGPKQEADAAELTAIRERLSRNQP